MHFPVTTVSVTQSYNYFPITLYRSIFHFAKCETQNAKQESVLSVSFCLSEDLGAEPADAEKVELHADGAAVGVGLHDRTGAEDRMLHP